MYSIDLYLDQTFIVPIGVFIFDLALLYVASCRFMRIRAKCPTDITNILWYIIVIIIAFFFIFLVTTDLMNGGIALAQEKNADVLTTEGNINNIISPSKRIRWFKYGSYRGADLLIDGEQYFVVTAEDFKIGDYVAIQYLPKSHFILHMIALQDGSEEEVLNMKKELFKPMQTVELTSSKLLLKKIWDYRVYGVWLLGLIIVMLINKKKHTN